MPANAGIFASLRRAGRVGRPAPENRGVPGSSPGLAIVEVPAQVPFVSHELKLEPLFAP
jgi:hypothetical protein